MKNDISPEERLFNAIAEGKKYPAGQKYEPKFSFRAFISGLLSTGKKVPTLRAAGMGQDMEAATGGFDLKRLNQILLALLVVLLGVFANNMLRQKTNLSQLMENMSTADSSASVAAPVEFLSVEDYTQEVDKRDIFHPIPPPEADVQQKPPEPKINPQDLIKDLALTGIYQGQSKEVMVEDKAAKKMYFLKEGDSIKGMKVKSVLKDRIILTIDGQDAELL